MAGPHCTDCKGILAEGTHCVGHLTEDEMKSYVARLGRGEALEAKKATIGGGAFKRLIAELERAKVERFGPLDFEEARFEEEMTFSNFEIAGGANFRGAHFDGFASFVKTTFLGDATFDQAVFSAGASFGEATFRAVASFAFSSFSELVRFDIATFSGEARFVQASFHGPLSLEEAHFADCALFPFATFESSFVPTKTTFLGDLLVIGSTFGVGVDFGPLVSGGALVLDEAVFEGRLRLEAATESLSCRSTRFKGSAELDVRWADIDLSDASFERRARVSGAESIARMDEQPARKQRDDALARPRLRSLRRAGVQYLSLSDLDLRACRFHDAHGLDEIRIEASCELAQAPPERRYTRRITLAEEHQMRAEARPSSPWYPAECQIPDEADSPDSKPLEAIEIVGTYRALRKALEDRGDIPGAGDFYYGEMEMRRLSSLAGDDPGKLNRGLGEKAIVTLYWLASGYGLRASRALACLFLAVLVGSVLYYLVGFEEGQSFGRSLFFSLESAISLLRAPTLELTPAGEGVQAALRLLGPVFLGLALLALRGRVKR